MPDFLSSSTDSSSEQAMNEALANVDHALAVLDQIIEKRAASIAGNLAKIAGGTVSGQSRSRRRTSTIVSNSISSIFSLISRSSNPDPMVFNPNAGTGNRFPASNGLQLSDLAALLQRMTGRNS